MPANRFLIASPAGSPFTPPCGIGVPNCCLIKSAANGSHPWVTTIGLDLAKHVFQAHGVDAEGATVSAQAASACASSVAFHIHCGRDPASAGALGSCRNQKRIHGRPESQGVVCGDRNEKKGSGYHTEEGHGE